MLEQPDGIGNGRSVFRNTIGNLLLRKPTIFDQPLIGFRFLDRIELHALDILDDRHLDKLKGFTKRMDWFLEHRTDLASLVAYKNEEFLDSPAARSIRILSEYLEPLDHFRREKIRDTIVFFGSARIARTDRFYKATVEIARGLAENHLAVITGGGPGIMEAANKGAALAKGKSVGLNIELPHEQKGNRYTKGQESD